MLNKNQVTATVRNAAFALAILAAAPFVSASLPVSADSTAAAAVGKAAPDFELKDIDGKTHKLSSYKGKFVVLEWFNDGCPFVKKHYLSHNMQNLEKEYTKQGVVWLSINSSAPDKQGNHTPAEYKKILADWKAEPTALLLDHDGKVGHLYGAKTTPDMFVIDKKGELVYAGAIDDKPSTDVEDVKGAKNYVKVALDEALAGKQVKIASEKSYGCSVKYAD